MGVQRKTRARMPVPLSRASHRRISGPVAMAMYWSAYLGLPLSLKGVGSALGLEKQKLDEGKELIRYFCMPCSHQG